MFSCRRKISKRIFLSVSIRTSRSGYNVNLFDPTLTKDRYNHYVELLYNCTDLVLYNIETQGFGKDRMFGGDKFEKFPDGTPIEYTILDKIKPKLNNYNYLEQLIDLEVLKIKGSSQSFDLIPSVFSAINIVEFPGLVLF